MLTPRNLTTTAALIVPAIIFIFFFIKKWKKSKQISLNLPPGPRTLPIIGNLHLITSPPFRCFRELSKRHGPIMYLKLGEAPAIVVSSPEIAKQMLKDHDPIFAGRPRAVAIEIIWYNYLDIAFCPYGDYWRQMRKICINQLLSPRIVRTFESIRRDESARLVDSLHTSCGKAVNLTERISLFSSSITCRAAFGKVCKDSETLIKLMMETLRMSGGFEIADFFPSSRIVNKLSWTKLRMKKMRRKLDVILDDVIDEHRENLARMAVGNRRDSGKRSGNGEFGSEDFVDVLLRAKEEEQLEFPIDNDNIKAILYDIFIGGTETSSTIIDWVMAELMRNPRVMGKAQAEVRQVFTQSSMGNLEENDIVQKLKYLKLVIRETLRLHPPAPMLPRASREECEINGYTIPANVKVLINIWAMQRDPGFWKDPESFEPERIEFNRGVDFTGSDFQFLPFGAGRRMCPGMKFGLTSVEMALAHLLYNFNWKLPEGVRAEDLEMNENLGIASSRKDNLFVIAAPYQPLG